MFGFLEKQFSLLMTSVSFVNYIHFVIYKIVSWKPLQWRNSLLSIYTRHKSELMIVLNHLRICSTKRRKKCPVPNVMQLKNVLFASTGVVEKESLKTILIKSNYYMTSLIKSFKSRKYIQNMNFYLSNSV